jgi:hypothetical protein
LTALPCCAGDASSAAQSSRDDIACLVLKANDQINLNALVSASKLTDRVGMHAGHTHTQQPHARAARHSLLRSKRSPSCRTGQPPPHTPTPMCVAHAPDNNGHGSAPVAAGRGAGRGRAADGVLLHKLCCGVGWAAAAPAPRVCRADRHGGTGRVAAGLQP